MIGYHASHEQFAPSELLRLTSLAQDRGFREALCSDHFYPWNERQGHSGYAWSWLGSALQATHIPFGVVNAPGQRYNPAIIAQAGATLAEMFPGRFWIALGSGQFLNEAITGEGWPPKETRNERLKTCAEIIRRLWRGEMVTNHEYFPVEKARLFTRAASSPAIIAAAITPETARWAASWADGLITVSRPSEKLLKVLEAFRQGGGEGKPAYLKVQISYDRSEQEALDSAWEQWKTNIFKSEVLTDLRLPGQLDAAAQFVDKEQIHHSVLVSSDPERHVQWLRDYADMGFEKIFLHNVNKKQEQFIEDFGKNVLPAFVATRASAAR